MTTVRERLDKGDFNHMSQVTQPDGSVLVTLTKRGDPHIYRLRVQGLYSKDEVVLEETVERSQHGD
jgi:hypothetical protein